MISGTYRVGIDIYTTLWYDPTGDCVRERVADSDYEDVLVGDATTLEPREVIDEDGCESCHDVIEFHGSGRVGVNYCIMCHTVGAEDSTSYNTGASIDMPNMIHKIHSSDSLENELCLAGYSGNSCFDVTFPRQDGGVEACEACHGDNDEWKDPSTRGCITCHDSEDAAAHAEINTTSDGVEACDVCHGDGRDYAADVVHSWPE